MVRQAEREREPQFARVAAKTGGIRGAAARAGRHTVHVVECEVDQHVPFLRGRGDDAKVPEAEVAGRVCTATEGVWRAHGGLRGGLCRRVARGERERRPMRAVRRGARRVGGNERHAYGRGAGGAGMGRMSRCRRDQAADHRKCTAQRPESSEPRHRPLSIPLEREPFKSLGGKMVGRACRAGRTVEERRLHKLMRLEEST